MIDGILLINKEPGWTSHDVVAKVRGMYNTKKVGHTGTLDPMAKGVLPICIGKATRLAEYISNNKKSYIVEARTGFSTNTYDITGSIENHSETKLVQRELEDILSKYRGEIFQRPPMFSAIKVKGKKLYEYARKGIEVERKSRKIFIKKLDLLEVGDECFKLYVECTSGTYIRTLVHDIGVDLSTYATMSSLVRDSVGNFKLSQTHTIDEINSFSEEKKFSILLPIDTAVEIFPKICLNEKDYSYALNGRQIALDKGIYHDQLHKVYHNGIFIGVGEVLKEKNILKMKKVFK